MSSERLLAALM